MQGLKNIGLMNKGEIRERQFIEKYGRAAMIFKHGLESYNIMIKTKQYPSITRTALNAARYHNSIQEDLHYRMISSRSFCYNEKLLIKYLGEGKPLLKYFKIK